MGTAGYRSEWYVGQHPERRCNQEDKDHGASCATGTPRCHEGRQTPASHQQIPRGGFDRSHKKNPQEKVLKDRKKICRKEINCKNQKERNVKRENIFLTLTTLQITPIGKPKSRNLICSWVEVKDSVEVGHDDPTRDVSVGNSFSCCQHLRCTSLLTWQTLPSTKVTEIVGKSQEGSTSRPWDPTFKIYKYCPVALKSFERCSC